MRVTTGLKKREAEEGRNERKRQPARIKQTVPGMRDFPRLGKSDCWAALHVGLCWMAGEEKPATVRIGQAAKDAGTHRRQT